MKNLLMYLLIFFLVVLLLLPPGLRMFGKNLYIKEDNSKKSSVYVLNCTGLNETINLSYLDDKPYNFQYSIKGNNINLDENVEMMFNDIIVDIMDYSQATYNEVDDVTEYRIAFNEMSLIPSELQNYSQNYEEQSAYYTNRGFQCTKISS